MHQVLSVGEVLIDFVSTKSGVSLKNAPQFVKCAGGAPANVAVGISKLGTRSAMVSKVGDDSFGKYLIAELHAARVETSGVVRDPDHKTRLAFVSLMKNGERDFEFWEQEPADGHLEISDVDRKSIVDATIVNIGSFLLLRNPSRATALHVAKEARTLGREVCYDPNLRLSLWKDQEEGKKVMLAMIRLSTITRMNDEEAKFFTGIGAIEGAAEKLRRYGPALVVITLGSKGCYFQTARLSGFVNGFRIRPVDTTGCGDGFLAGLLHGLSQSEKKLEDYLPEEMRAICTVANAVGALVALKRGGIAAMPTGRELRQFLAKKGND
jgi:sugar/nucleoside kinase (ribokinase family)